MSVFDSPNIYQENISEIFKGFETVCAYIDNVLVMTKQKFEDDQKISRKFSIETRRIGIK